MGSGTSTGSVTLPGRFRIPEPVEGSGKKVLKKESVYD